MHLIPTAPQGTVIGRILEKFAAGDLTLFEAIAEDIDFRIDHFRDETDTTWQSAMTREGLMAMFARLGSEVFPQGTEALGIECFDLGEGWYLTRFNQRFFYGVRQKVVTSLTYIVSHEADGLLDYFRENVTNTVDVA